MTLSTPMLAGAPLLAGLIGSALVGAAPAPQQAEHPVTAPIAGSMTGPGTGPASVAPQAGIVEHVAARTPADQQRVLDYWTPQRMAKALPIELLGLVTSGKGLLSDLTGGRVLPALTGQTAGQAVPGRTARTAVPRHHAAAAPSASTVGTRWGSGGLVARTTGRVFLTVAGADFVCSASTVKSANKDLVVTAGHCVKDGAGEWAANWTFVPGYGSGGKAPFGQYTARRMFVPDPWSRSGDDNYDVGMVALATSRGRHVADVVGTQEIAFNAPRGGQAYGFGYPADPPYDGGHLVYCAGRLRNDPHGQTRDQGLGCAMTAGSSGGPWMTTFNAATGRGTITSLSSFKYSDDQRTMYGPYFGDAAKALYTMAGRA
ncbi:trypsin-like serine peptidase [Nonomuraea diastatica]|uniref:trypsin-like serine peptidase n=1 Tax=Nonomuraea diastatica TaxID=1848329 RepID=UPI00140B51B2|nr:trypsin-like serine protease [Nonomuraea diastatica]